ncbi:MULTISPECIES: hypothetical protein [Aurantimonas]
MSSDSFDIDDSATAVQSAVNLRDTHLCMKDVAPGVIPAIIALLDHLSA